MMLKNIRRQRHKFHAERTICDGINFASKLEAHYYQFLKREQAEGRVVMFLRQVPIHLPGAGKLVIDFQVFHADGSVAFVDTKGVQTESWKGKRKQVEALYPITIEIVTKI